MREELLNSSLISKLREAVNKTNIFLKDEEESKYYNLLCVVMDRLETAQSYINSHTYYPKTEEDFIFFMVFACMIIDAIKLTLQELKIDDFTSEDKKYFKEVSMSYPMELTEEKCPTDENFFAYFRSLVFAHPFNTTRPKFFKKNEVQYSPFVLANQTVNQIHGTKDAIGVMIYTNMKKEPECLIMQFMLIKEYTKSRYELLKIAIERLNAIIQVKENKWKSRKVNRKLKPINILEDIIDILNERYIDCVYYFEELLSYLKCATTIKENEKNVSMFKSEIIKVIDKLCDAIDQMDYETACVIVTNITDRRPKKAHDYLNYQLEKIYGYLNENEGPNNFNWGLQQAELFSNEFAKKWVIIRPYEMNSSEIKLLTTVACYLESESEAKHEMISTSRICVK